MKPILLVFTALCSASALAQPPAAVSNSAAIDDSGRAYQGNMTVNQAAGDMQQQANARAFALGQGASATTQIRQRLNTPADAALDARANIGGTSFSHGNGALGVNQSAGAGTQQANALRISIGTQPQSIDDSVLLQQNVTLLNTFDSAATSTGHRQVTTSDQAFTGGRGVVQLNQSAGVGNRMANTLSIRVAD
nr:adhesin [uncultured Pseudomonas sp.]